MTNKYIDEVATYLPFSGEHSQLIADTTYAYSRSLNKYVVATGDNIQVIGGQIYEVAASGASDEHFTTAGGVKLYEAGPDFTNKTRAEEWKTRLDAESRTVKDGYVITFDGVTAKAVSGSTSIPSLDDFEYSGFTPADESKLDNIATQYDDVTAFLASTDTFADNTYVRTKKEGFSYKAVPSGGDVTNAGGQGFEVMPNEDGSYSVRAFGALGNWNNSTQSGADDQAAFQAACDRAGKTSTVAGRVVTGTPDEGMEFYLGSSVELGNNGPVEIHGPHPETRIIRKSGDDFAFTSHVSDWCGVFLGIIGQGGNDPENNGSDEYYPAILSSKRFKCDVFVGWCGGTDYTGTSEYTLEGNQDEEPVTGHKRSRCYAVGLIAGDGTNYSDVRVRGAYIGGDVVFIATEPGSVRNQNGMKVMVRSMFGGIGYAVNLQRGLRNKIEVFTAQGGDTQGVIRCADTANDLSVYYTEADVGGGYSVPGNLGRAYLLEGAQNVCKLLYAPGWVYQDAGPVNETFALVDANNEVSIDGPVRFEYNGTNGKIQDGSPTDFRGGIKFGASGSTLSEYVEGSYAATLTPATSGSITLTGSQDTLAYTRIGRQVSVIGQLNVDSVSSPVGSYLEVTLPFDIANLSELSARSFGTVLNTDTDAVYPFNAVSEGQSVGRIVVDASMITASDGFGFSLTYFTDE